MPGGDGLPAASVLGVHMVIRAEVEALGRPALLQQFDLILTAIESPVLSLGLFGRPVRFSSLPQAEREALMKAWATSPIPLKRTAYQNLKQLVLLYTYGQEGSPYRALAGYEAPTLDPPAPTRLTVRTPRADELVDCDVCVIGSGAGGGVVAATLAASGKRVVVLERARLLREDGFDGRELAGQARLFLDRGLTTTTDSAIAIRAGSAVGGGTVVNWSTSLRIPDDVREEWRAAGIADDLDWHYRAVEGRMNVNTDESPRNAPNAMLEKGLRALSYAATTIPRNVRGCGDCGPCVVGCRRGAKQSSLRTFLADACGAGAEILDGCDARRIVVEDGRAQGVIARVDGGELFVHAKQIALAGGSICSPAVLLRSGIARDRAGRGLRLHPVAVVAGHYDGALVPWRGVPQSVMSEEFAHAEGAYGFRFECAPAHPGLMASGFPWWGSEHHLRQMEHARHTAPLLGIVRDREGGRVYLDRQGAPLIDYFPHEMERRLLVRAQHELAKIHVAAGAHRVHTLHTPPLEWKEGENVNAFHAEIDRRGVVPNRLLLFSAHQMSTCAIGTSPKASVADPDARVWGVPGLYVTDASAFPSASGVNPMLSIMALARRAAQKMLAASS